MRLWMAVCETLLQYVISRLLIYNAKILHGGQLHREPKKPRQNCQTWGGGGHLPRTIAVCVTYIYMIHSCTITFCSWLSPGKSLHMNMCVFSLCSTPKKNSSRTRESSSLWSMISLYRTSASAMSWPCFWGRSSKLSFSTSRIPRHCTWIVLDWTLVRGRGM